MVRRRRSPNTRARAPWVRTLLPALALASLGQLAAANDPWVGQEQARATFERVVELFKREYWDPEYIDWDSWAAEHRSSVLGATSRAEFDRALGRMVRVLGDDHSSWAGLVGLGSTAPEEADPGPWEEHPLRLGVQFVFMAGRGLVVERVFPATPADDAGLKRGDVIVSVDGTSLASSSSFTDANGLLLDALERGRALLEVERRRTPLTIEVTAAPVAFADVASRPYASLLDTATGYLAVPTFNVEGVGTHAHALLHELIDAGAVTLVLDLRGNLGGRLVELGLLLGAFSDGVWAEAVSRGEIAFAARFDREGADGIARLIAPDGEVLSEARVANPAAWRGPVVVITGSENASAGEIAALALQDLGLARVVGEPTGGNVEAVRGFALPDGSRVLIAVANMRGANGLDFDAGVVPHVVVRSTTRELARGVDVAVAEARRLLGVLPFTPDRYF